MITAPEVFWIIFNALSTASTLRPGNENRSLSFGLALGSSALSCALLSSGLLHFFLGMEVSLWMLATLVVLLGLAVKPPGDDGVQIGKLALSSGIRLTLALIVWLWA
jgi:hypothetical protein